MCNDTSLLTATLEPTRLLLELLDGMEGTTGLESPDALEVLTFEPEPHDGSGRGSAGPFSVLELGGGPGAGCQAGDGRVGQHGGLVDVRLY